MWLLQEGEVLAIQRAVQWERLPAPALVGAAPAAHFKAFVSPYFDYKISQAPRDAAHPSDMQCNRSNAHQ